MRVVTRRPSPVAVAVLACTVTLTACGSGSKKPVHSQAHDSMLTFSQCMQAHDVPNFPDPSGAGGNQISSNSPAFQAAQAACAHLLPGGGPTNQKPTREEMAEGLAVSRCMRAHGVSGFPDPTDKMPANASPKNYSLLLTTSHGVVFAVPRTINPMTPAFQNAVPICHFGPRNGQNH